MKTTFSTIGTGKCSHECFTVFWVIVDDSVFIVPNSFSSYSPGNDNYEVFRGLVMNTIEQMVGEDEIYPAKNLHRMFFDNEDGIVLLTWSGFCKNVNDEFDERLLQWAKKLPTIKYYLDLQIAKGTIEPKEIVEEDTSNSSLKEKRVARSGKAQIVAIMQEMVSLSERMAVLERENSELKSRLESLESQSASAIETSSTPKSITKNVLGFSLAKSSKGFWYAVKRIGKGQKSVYIGRNPQEAETKIMAYCQAKGIELPAQ